MGQPGFFDLDERLSASFGERRPAGEARGLDRLRGFPPEVGHRAEAVRWVEGGRPPYDPVLMFKILVLQTLYTLSFMRFLGLGFEDAVPDAKTVWLFREHLT